MKKNLVLFLSLLALASCSTTGSKEDRELNAKVKSQQSADSPQEIAARAAEAFSAAPGLSADQKMKLHSIYTRVYVESMQIRREIGQSKSLLFMYLANPDYKASEMNRLKKKIMNLDQKRLNIMFEAFDDVQKIVGRGVETDKIYQHFLDHEYPSKYDY